MEDLFVYGSLMRGLVNHGELLPATFVRADRTLDAWTLRDLGAYPALVEGGHGPVAGEVFAVGSDAWPRLDDFEGVPWLYRRVRVLLGSGSSAWTYVHATPSALGHAAIVPGGDWRAWLATRR